MARNNSSILVAVLFGPGALGISTLALWENEGRFDYYRAAVDAAVVSDPAEVPTGEAFALTGSLAPVAIDGEYVDAFRGYLSVRRYAEIYAWVEETDSDGNTTRSREWSSSVESTSGNENLVQRLESGTLYPDEYRVGPLTISPSGIHLVDVPDPIDPFPLQLDARGRALGLTAEGGYLYLRATPGETTLGDERLDYTGEPAAAVATYFGAVQGGVGVGRQFEQHEGFISELIQNDGVLHHLANGARDEALEPVRFDYRLTVWLVRTLGTLGIVLGLWAILSRFASIIFSARWLRGLVRAGTFVVAAAIGLPFALLVIGSSMIFHNPLVAMIPLGIGLVASVLLVRRSDLTGRYAKAKRDRKLDDRLESRRREEEAFERLTEDERRARLLEMEIEETFIRLAALGRLEDGLDSRERDFLMRWGRRNGIDGERMDHLMGSTGDVASDTPTRDDLELLVYMALADGALSGREYAALQSVAGKLGLSSGELQAIIEGVEAEVGS